MVVFVGSTEKIKLIRWDSYVPPPGYAAPAVIIGNDVTNEGTLTSSDETVVTVDADGLLTGVRVGTAIITGRYTDPNRKQQTATIEVAVLQDPTS